MDTVKEKIAVYGDNMAAYTSTELLSILLGVDEKAFDNAKQEYGCYALPAIMENPKNVPGIGENKALKVKAIAELARLLATRRYGLEAVHSPEDVARYLMPRLHYEKREHFVVILLNRKNKIMGTKTVSVGSLSASIVHPREVFRPAIMDAAAAIVVAHNHPSGDPTPSREDIAVTRRLVRAGELLDIPVLDHVIIGDNRYHSFKQKGMMS